MTPSFEPARNWHKPVTPQAPYIQKAPGGGFLYIRCLGAGSNRRPFELQSNALPTELPKQIYLSTYHSLLQVADIIAYYEIFLIATSCKHP